MKPTKMPYHVKYVCMNCSRTYDAIGPLSYVDPDVGSNFPGLCTEACMDRYMRDKRIPTAPVAHEDVKYLKSKGWHDLADWIATGGLEDIMGDDR